jgi:hypothetical protein
MKDLMSPHPQSGDIGDMGTAHAEGEAQSCGSGHAYQPLHCYLYYYELAFISTCAQRTLPHTPHGDYHFCTGGSVASKATII